MIHASIMMCCFPDMDLAALAFPACHTVLGGVNTVHNIQHAFSWLKYGWPENNTLGSCADPCL